MYIPQSFLEATSGLTDTHTLNMIYHSNKVNYMAIGFFKNIVFQNTHSTVADENLLFE